MIRRKMRDDTARGKGIGLRYNIRIVTVGRDIAHGTTCQRARAGNDMTAYVRDTTGRALRHGRPRPATWPRHDRP